MMALSDQLQQLEEKLAARLRTSVQSLREEVDRHLQQSHEEVSAKLDGLSSDLGGPLLDAGAFEPIAAEAEGGGRANALSELRDALSALDAAGSQSDILSQLLEQAGRFASRSALFLTQADSARGWGSYGFGDGETKIAELSMDYEDGSPWARLAEGSGCVELSAAECAQLCSRLESPVPQAGVLIPLVLRDQVAAALYADRLGDDDATSLEALQSLVFVAAQTIETLPFRNRNSTPTLRGAEGAAEKLGVWDPVAAAGGAVAAGAAVAASAAVAATAAEEEVEAEDATEDEPEAEVEAVSAELELSPEPEAGPPAEEALDRADEPPKHETASLTPTDFADALAAAPEVEVEEDDSADEAVGPVAASAPPPAETATIETAPAVEPVTPPPSPPAADRPQEVVVEPEPQIEEAFEIEIDEPEVRPADSGTTVEPSQSTIRLDDIELRGEETMLLDRSPFEEAIEAAQPEPLPTSPVTVEPTVLDPPPAEEPPGIADTADSAFEAEAPDAGDETGDLDATASKRLSGSPEVKPPEDITGPGRAFANASPPPSVATEAPAEEEGALFQEGRRLARLLVSEIRLYNEERVEEGRRNRDIYSRLREDIERSRKMYEERVNERVLSTTNYFDEELVRILAGGDEGALGA